MKLTGHASGFSSFASSRAVAFSHTVPAGNNRVMFFALLSAGQLYGTIGADYNSVPMTLIGAYSLPFHSGAGGVYIWLFYLLNPDVGTFAANGYFTSGAEAEALYGISTSFDHVNQTTPYQAVFESQNDSLGHSIMPATAQRQACLLDFIAGKLPSALGLTITAGAKQTQIEYIGNSALADPYMSVAASVRFATGAFTITEDFDNTPAFEHIGVVVNPDAVGGGFFF